MKIISIVGTRPQLLKLSPLAKNIKQYNINHIIIHSGQHYDFEMSENLINSIQLPNPDYLLTRDGNTSIQILANMMIKIEEICIKEKPDKIIIFGDCDTTIAGALVAKKLKIYLIHIEAGMRSYNKDMPEEINRIMTDHIADMLLCSTTDSINKLRGEGIVKNVHFVGNLQLELLKNICDTYNNIDILNEHNIFNNDFCLLTIHREYNTNANSLNMLFMKLVSLNIKIIFPVHPRTRNIIEKTKINIPDNIKLIKPVNYLDMTILERYCKYIITDSGGIQPEAWFLGKKCVIIRSETEWIEPLINNNNILYDNETPLNIFINDFLKKNIIKTNIDLNASKNILNLLI